MLWDWSQITLAETIIFSVVSIGILYIVGFSCIGLISKLGRRPDPFGSLDFLQRLTSRIVFGFVFIVLFVVLFSFFGLAFSISTAIIAGVVVVSLVINRSALKLRIPPKLPFGRLALMVIILVTLLSTLFLASALVTGSFGATNDDGADHTLMTRIVLEDPAVLYTRSGQPYANFLIRYPLGTHVLSAFFVTLLGVPIQKIVVLLSVTFPALIALSFYSITKSIFGRRSLALLSFMISAFFTVGLSYAPITWGGLPLLLSFFFTIGSMSLIFSFALNEKLTILKVFLIGAIFFTAMRTYPIALLVLFLWFALVFSVKILLDFRNAPAKQLLSSSAVKKTVVCLLAFLLPILLALPYFYALYTNNFDATQTNLLNQVTTWSDTIKSRIGFNWLFDLPMLSSFFSVFGSLLALTPLCLIPLILLSIPRLSQKISGITSAYKFRLGIIVVYVFALLVLAYLTLTLYLPIDLMTAFFDPARVWQHLYIPGVILTSVVIFFGFNLLYLGLKKFVNIGQKVALGKFQLNRNQVLACTLLSLVVLGAVAYTFPVVTEQQGVYNQTRASANNFQTLKEDDVLLMKWIRENIPSTANILVSSGDSGQFLASVTQRLTVSINSRLGNYSDLMALLSSNSSDKTAIPLMLQYNITYVYIGSTATTYALSTPYYRSFNSTQFLSTPYFVPIKNEGNAWLFEFNVTKALKVSEQQL